MIYHPSHFHGISHEADIQWMVNLPSDKQVVIGDGVTTRFRLKHEARKLSCYGGAVGLQNTMLTAAMGADITREIVKRFWKHIDILVEIDNDSHYINITPPLVDGRQFMVEYHYVRELE